jgi:hypothetical protein
MKYGLIKTKGLSIKMACNYPEYYNNISGTRSFLFEKQKENCLNEEI